MNHPEEPFAWVKNLRQLVYTGSDPTKLIANSYQVVDLVAGTMVVKHTSISVELVPHQYSNLVFYLILDGEFTGNYIYTIEG